MSSTKKVCCLQAFLAMALVGLAAGLAPAQDFTDSGFITTWLFLGPYHNPGGNAPGEGGIRADFLTDGTTIFEQNFFPKAGDTVESNCNASGGAPCYMNPDPALTTPTVEAVDATSTNPTTSGAAITNQGGGTAELDTADFNMYWAGQEGVCPDAGELLNNVMGYAFTYVNNTTGSPIPVIGNVSSDDSVQVIIGTSTAFVDNVARGVGASGVVQDTFEGAVLQPGVNRLVVKVFDGCGGWSFRFRFLNANTCEPLKEPDITIQTTPPADTGVKLLASRTLPNPIDPASNVQIQINIKVLSPVAGSAVVKEQLPFTYPYVAGSASNGGTFAGGAITWNLPGPLSDKTLTYEISTPDTISSAVFKGTVTVGTSVTEIGGDSGIIGGDPGWIKDWLVLNQPIMKPGTIGVSWNNPGATGLQDWISDDLEITEQTVVPEDGLAISPDFSANGARYLNNSTTATFMTISDDDGCVDLNPLLASATECVAYVATYVTNPLDSDLSLYMGAGSDDSIDVLINGKRVWYNSVPRGFCGGIPGGPQDTFPVTLRPGTNLLLCKIYEGGGGWNYAARFQDSSGGVVVLPTGVDPGDYVAPDKVIRITRDIDNNLQNGKTGPVTITVTPIIGSGVVVINEVLPAGLTPSNPSNGGVLSGQSIAWNLGTVDSEIVLSYTLTAAADALDALFASTATLDGSPVTFVGDTGYTGSPINRLGFIKLWNHLGPLGGGSCDPGADLDVDWIVNDGETLTEANMNPFPGMIMRPKYGGDGMVPGGTGARAAGLITATIISPGDPTLPVVWKPVLSPKGTIIHEVDVYDFGGLNPENHLTMSCVYLTNHTGAAIDTDMGIASDDSMSVVINQDPPIDFHYCRGYGGEDTEQNTAPVTLPPGESRILVKVSDGCCQSGFRLRFHAAGGPASCTATSGAGGLLPPAITVSTESVTAPPPAKVERLLSSDSYSLGDSVTVTLRVTAPVPTGVVVTEVLPAKAVAAGISDGGVLNGNTVQWNLAAVTQKSVSYSISADSCAGDLVFGTSSVLVGPIESGVTGKKAITRNISDDGISGWTSRDINATGGAAQRMSDHGILVSGGGDGVKLQKDSFRFVSTPETGDFEFSSRIDCLDDPAVKGLAGLMVRDVDDPGSVNAFFGLSAAPPAGGGVGTLKGTFRGAQGKSTSPLLPSSAAKDVPALPIYLKIKRTGTALSFQRSADGVTYTELVAKVIGTGTGQIGLGAATEVGLAVSAGGGGFTRATLSAVSGPAFTVAGVNPPTNLAAVGGSKQVALSWSAPAAGAAPGSYLVKRGSAGGPYTQVAEVTAPATTYTDTGLADNTQFCYVVASKKGTSVSADSGESCAKTTGAGGGPTFRRGDVDANGVVEITDAVKLLGYLFLGGGTPECLEAGDTDNNGTIDITDAVTNLGYQFLGQAPPAAPGPINCGADPAEPMLGCTKSCQ